MRQTYSSAAVVTLSIILVASPAFPQSGPHSEISANELARRVVTNELKAANEDHSHWMYRLGKEETGKKQVREIIQTKLGSLGKLLSVNDRPLTERQEQDENRRILKLINNPDEQLKLERARNEDAAQSRRLLQMLPDAFVFSDAGHQGDLVKLKFTPNPNFHPSSREARVFHAMEGEMWIEYKKERLTRITGHLVQDVNFGGGLLGHLDKGGQFEVKQAEVAPGHWDMTVLNVDMRGKALFFKTIGVHEKEYRSHFRPVADDLTPAQAADILIRKTAEAIDRS